METETVLLATTLTFAVSTIISPIVAIARGKEALKEKQQEIDALERKLVDSVNDIIQMERWADKRIKALKTDNETLSSRVAELTPKQGKDGKFVSKSKS